MNVLWLHWTLRFFLKLHIHHKYKVSQCHFHVFVFLLGCEGFLFYVMSCAEVCMGLQRDSHLCEEMLWTHHADRELCEDRHEAVCTHSTRHCPLGDAERTKEVKLPCLAKAILLITIWSLFSRPSPSLTCHDALPSLFHLPLSTDFKYGKPLPPPAYRQNRSRRCLVPAVSAVEICILIWQTIVCKFPHLSDICKYL